MLDQFLNSTLIYNDSEVSDMPYKPANSTVDARPSYEGLISKLVLFYTLFLLVAELTDSSGKGIGEAGSQSQWEQKHLHLE